MYELRWVQNGQNVQLQMRSRAVVIDNWGAIRRVDDWGEWQVVPIFLAEGAKPDAELPAEPAMPQVETPPPQPNGPMS